MKTKFLNIIKFVLILASGVLLVSLIFYLIDIIFNGVLGDWFYKNYITYYGYPTGYGGYYSDLILNWNKLKSHVFLALIITTVFWISVILLVSYFSKRRAKKQTAEDIGKMIHDHINQDTDLSAVFPDEYVKISAEMTEIKSNISRKEQILKEESSRKNDLIAYLAHDLKTPTIIIFGRINP